MNTRTSTSRAHALVIAPAVLPAMNLGHLHSMTDATGLLQHAAFRVPRYSDGYCLDDNARALHLMTLLSEHDTEEPLLQKSLKARYLAFVLHAYNPQQGRFRNFLSYSRRWTEDRGSEDSHGRALWALGTVLRRAEDSQARRLAAALFHAALAVLPSFTSPRAWAYTLLGIEEYLHAFQGDRAVESLQCALAERLLDLYRRSSDHEWQWFEEQATYCNARLPQALLQAGARLGRDDMSEAGFLTLSWLAKVQGLDSGCFAPIGSNGFYQRGSKAEFDQQPVEACAMVSACLDALHITGDLRWFRHARKALDWFLGENHLSQPLYDSASGGCRDGLHPNRPNENQGAESTLSWLVALAELRAIHSAKPV